MSSVKTEGPHEATPPTERKDKALRPSTLLGLWTTSDIAKYGGVSRQRAWEWTQMKGFPKPKAQTSTGGLWRPRTVQKWVDAFKGRDDSQLELARVLYAELKNYAEVGRRLRPPRHRSTVKRWLGAKSGE